jgi:hypothetical protein
VRSSQRRVAATSGDYSEGDRAAVGSCIRGLGRVYFSREAAKNAKWSEFRHQKNFFERRSRKAPKASFFAFFAFFAASREEILLSKSVPNGRCTGPVDRAESDGQRFCFCEYMLLTRYFKLLESDRQDAPLKKG